MGVKRITTSGPSRVRKRRSPFSFIAIISIFVLISALKSTFGEHSKHHTTEATGETDTETNSNNNGQQHHHQSTTTSRPELETQLSTSQTTDESPGDNATSFWGDRCVKPAIEQFPPTIMSPKFRNKGGFIIHIAVAAYTFLALAIICDEFFVPSLERMCEVLKIQPDVAGATFMAAGSSAPELATALIGVFIAKDDIGVSGVIGSAVFNITFVISVCGLCCQTIIYLNWWPMVRDCFFYMLSILALLICIYDEKIEWYESIFLLLVYALYIWAMYMNTVLEAWAHTLPIPFPAVHQPVPGEKSGLVTFKASSTEGTTAAAYGDTQQSSVDYSAVGGFDSGFGGGQEQHGKVPPAPPISIATLLSPPEESGGFKNFMWRISLPLVYLFYYTVPDCRLERWHSWYVVTFTMAMVWIAVFSYIMVWMITIVGFTLGIPDTVMGLTFVAAGVSVPDALSSLAVMREGLADMAVSNAVGSNVFDILICLGLPWFFATVVINPGDSVQVISKGLTYSTVSLLSTVAFLILATHYNGWRLNKTYGVVLMLWYLLFMILASLYELNVFGEFNPPECSSIY